MSDKPLVLDSWPLMALFENQEQAPRVEEELLRARADGRPFAISVVNAGELWYANLRAYSRETAEQVIERTKQLNVEFVAVDWAIARQAAEYKARGGISYADCFAAATARQIGGQVLTGDREFEVVSDEVEVIWI